jgi:uncharacterized pyridoxamine 5'-phosphate oxidase family protein
LRHQEINISELKEKIIKFLEGKRAIVLATTSNNRVTARTVSFVNNGLHVFFWSYRNHTKCKQIKENPNVALCRDNLQVEGTASLHGSILNNYNIDYLTIFKKKFPKDYKRYVNEPDMTLVKVKPILFILLVNIDGTLYRDHLDVTNKHAYRIELKD